MKTPKAFENTLEGMKTTILRSSTRSLLAKKKLTHTSTPYSEAIHIGILFTVEDRQKHEHIKELIKSLERDGKKVTALCFLPDNRENYEFKFNYYTKADVSFWGNLTSSDALNFSDVAFDFLYCLDQQPNIFILNVIARSKAKCRIGPNFSEGKSYFEMMIESNFDIKDLIDGVYRYSKQLR